jgi:hypothetical protein
MFGTHSIRICASMFGASQAAKESLAITQELFFVGTIRPTSPKAGDMYLDTSTESNYVYTNNVWVEISPVHGGDNYQPRLVTSPLLQKGRCSCCGGADTGEMKCNYCKTTLRWYTR